MYESHFNINERPFELEPSAKYLYQSVTHSEAIMVIGYALSSRSGFSVLTGGFGTGKSSVIKTLTKDLTSVVIQNTKNTTYPELLQQLTVAFGISPSDCNAKNVHALEQFWSDTRSVLVIDEAQYLSLELIEQVRLLCDNRVCVIFSGTEELQNLVSHESLSALQQRIKANCSITALDIDEMSEYIRHRIKVAGNDSTLFNASTLPLIHDHTKGIPRLINSVCDKGLLFAFSEEKPRVDHEIISEVIKEEVECQS